MRLMSIDPKAYFSKSGKSSAIFKSSHMGASLKTAQLAQSNFGTSAGFGSNTIYTQPQFFSPLHTPQNWQIPSKVKEIRQWARYYLENEPKVAASISFYSEFPVNGFENECPDYKIKMHYDNLCKRLNMDYWTRMISHEYYGIGDVFPFLEYDCKHCGGSGVDPKNPQMKCRHQGGTFKRLFVMNPDWIDVQWNILVEEPLITLTPDDELRRIVMNKSPLRIYDKLPVNVRQLIAAGQPIPLSNRSVSHLKHCASPYQVYGTSLIRRLFKTLAYKDKLMTAQWIVAERLILPIRIVKVGTDDRPAGPEDIADVQANLAAVANDPNLTLVTHHGLEYVWEGAAGKVLTLSNEFELSGQEILDGMMLNQALLNGEMASYGGLAIGVETMIQRMESWRLTLKRWIEDKIYKTEAMMQGFIDDEASKELGEIVYMYPKIRWNDLNMRDRNQELQTFIQLHEKQVISAETLCEKANVDYDQETERIRYEQATMASGMGGAPGMGGVPIGGGGGGGMGLPPLGGPEAGGMGGLPPLGGPEAGGLPPLGGEAGAPPIGGDMGAPSIGAPPAGPAPGPMASLPSSQKIMKPEKRKKLERMSKHEKEGVVENKIIQFTSIEKKMYKGLITAKIPYRKYAQFEVKPYTIDFALPDLKVGIECDGETFHSSPAQKERDQKRDAELSKMGCTIVRFGEKEIEHQFAGVIARIVNIINQKAHYLRSQLKKKS